MHRGCTRREWLSGLAGVACYNLFKRPARAQTLPTSPVALAQCTSYDAEALVTTLATMFDQLGGLGELVADKTVAVKINLVGDPWGRLGELPPELTYWTHPAVIGATLYLLSRAGAKRLRVLECCGGDSGPIEKYITQAGWDPAMLLGAAPGVELENTNGLGSGSAYARLNCLDGGYVFPGFDVNHSYVDCDVFVSIPKMKEHSWFGVTLGTKNCYGMTPLTIYGDSAGEDAPSVDTSGTRVTILHNGQREPSRSAPQENDSESPRDATWRIPRIVADIAAARPIHLVVIDGIQSMAGGEGPWASNARPVSPGLLLAGRNPVTTDAVAMAAMGFDPMADRGAAPFEGSDSFLRFAEERGIGTRDLSQIEVVGTPIEQARFDFRAA